MPLRKNGSRSDRSEQPASRRLGTYASAFRKKRPARNQTRPRKRLGPRHMGLRRNRSPPPRWEGRMQRWRSMSLSPPPHRPIRRAVQPLRWNRVSPLIQRRRIPRSPCKRTRTTQSNTRSLTYFCLPVATIFHAGRSLYTTVGLLKTKGHYWQLVKVMHCFLCRFFSSACM